MKTIQKPDASSMKISPARNSHQPVLAVMAVTLSLAFAAPAMAAPSELEALKQAVEQQRQVLEQQQKMIERLEQQVAEQGKASSIAAGQAAVAAKPSNEKPLLTFYGILDGGVEHLTNIGTDGHSLTRVPGITATLPSRLGLKLDKEFKPGFHGIGTLELGFNLDDGTQGQSATPAANPDRIFGRQAFVGVATPYGSLTVGRQYSMLMSGMSASDLLGPNIYGMSSLDVYLPNARYDNSIVWQGKFSNISAGVAYSFGRDTNGSTPASGVCAGEQTQIGDAQGCTGLSAMLRYDTETYGGAVAVDQIKGGQGATAYFFNGAKPLAFNNSSDTDRRVNVGGHIKMGAAKFGIGWLGRKVDTTTTDVSSNAYYVYAGYKVNEEISLDGGINRMINTDQDRSATLSVVRGFYNLYKGLDTYIQAGYLTNSSKAAYQLSAAGCCTAPAAGNSQEGYMVGMRYIF